MELWNDFEGKTVDGRFHLDHLIGPKGRSAYFTTKDEAGAPATIRLIESLNDEEEILTRWRLVTGLKEEHLLEVLACGQTVIDGTHLVYAVMEPTDMELADVLRERALSTEETKQIALSVADGLQALHAKGLVHEHVEADNVLAQGETIKLRSDVAREAPDGAEGAALRSKDVRELSLLLSQCLTRSRRFGETRLPVPFEEVVRKGESGAWGLTSMVAALQPQTTGLPTAQAGRSAIGRGAAGSAPANGSVSPATAVVSAGTGSSVNEATKGANASERTGGDAMPVGGSTSPSVSGSAVPVRSNPAVMPLVAAAAGAAAASGPSTAPAAVASRLANQARDSGDGVAAHLRSPRIPDRIVMEPAGEPKRRGLLAAVAAGVLLLVLLGIYFLRAGRAGQTGSVVQDAPSAMTVPQQSSNDRPPARDTSSAPTAQRVEKPSAAVGANGRPGSSRHSAGGTGANEVKTSGVVAGGTAPSEAAQWRVVAFTYNREDQAAQRVKTISARNPGMKPEVFSPNGRAPYLVTLGGWMSVDRAAALKLKARSEGVARDVYAQNYRGKGR